MKELHRTLLFLSILCGLAQAGRAADAVAHLRYSSDGDTLRVNGEAFLLPRNGFRGWQPEMEQLRADIAAGEEVDGRAATLGRALLGSAAQSLREAGVWIVEPVEMAPLSVLFAPWDGRRVLEQAVVYYQSPSTAADSTRREAGGALIVAPFHPDGDPRVDAPDTLQWELAAAERRVESVPRNDAHAEGVAAILDERSGYALCWLRADEDQFSSLGPVLRRVAPLLLWTQPLAPARPEGLLARAKGFEHESAALVLDLYDRSEGRSAGGVARFLAALSEGHTVAGALREGRLELAREGSLRDWAGWICVGGGGGEIELRRPAWYQRWLRRKPVSADSR